MTIATVGARFQVVIPRRERQTMGLKPKTRLNVEVRGGEIVLHPVGVAKLRGIGKAMADGSDAVDYVRRLRNEWEHRR